MAWCRTGDKPLSKLMMVILLTHLCVTHLRWINENIHLTQLFPMHAIREYTEHTCAHTHTHTHTNLFFEHSVFPERKQRRLFIIKTFLWKLCPGCCCWISDKCNSIEILMVCIMQQIWIQNKQQKLGFNLTHRQTILYIRLLMKKYSYY